MSVITPTVVDTPRMRTVTWTSITTADTGAKVDVSDLEDIKTFHVVGAGTAQLQRSNDGTNFVTDGAAMAANSVNDKGPTAVQWYSIGTVATNTVTVIMTAKRKK